MNRPESEVIRERMALIRRDLHQDVGAVVEQARELTDWRGFVRRHGVLCVSAAAAVGFLMVPQRLQVMSPSAEALEKLAKKNRLVVKPRADVRRQAGVAGPLFNLIAGMAVRSALNMIGQQVGLAMQPTDGDAAQRQGPASYENDQATR